MFVNQLSEHASGAAIRRATGRPAQTIFCDGKRLSGEPWQWEVGGKLTDMEKNFSKTIFTIESKRIYTAEVVAHFIGHIACVAGVVRIYDRENQIEYGFD